MTKKHSAPDMLNGPLWNKLLLFAAPVAATAILEQLFNASDIAVVGNFSGGDKTVAVAAVSANSAVIALMLNLFIGIALGANVVIAHAIGRGDKKTVKKAVHTSVTVSLIAGVLVSAIGILLSGPALSALDVPNEVLPSALLYLRIYLVGMPVILLYNFEAAIYRSIGDTKTPLVTLLLSGILNVILNLIFVALLGMTVDGVAIATVISNAVSALILFVKLTKTSAPIRLTASHLRIDWPTLWSILKIGLPAGIQSAVFALSNIVIQSAINSLGKVVMAASGAAYNIEIFTYDIVNSFTQACTTFVGQNYGAGKIGRCRKTLALCLLEGALILASAIFIVLFFGKNLLAIFNSDPEVVTAGYTRLMMAMVSHSFCLLYEVMSGYLRGFGISLVPAVLTTAGVCGVRILWIEFVFPKIPTFKTIMIAYPVSLSVTALLMFIALLCCRPAKKAKKIKCTT